MDNSARQNGCGGGISVDDSTLNLTGNSGRIDAINSNMVSLEAEPLETTQLHMVEESVQLTVF